MLQPTAEILDDVEPVNAGQNTGHVLKTNI